MKYGEKELLESKRLFSTPHQIDLCHSTCEYCKKPVAVGYRLKGEEAFMHSDCFILDVYDKFSEIGHMTPIDVAYQIESVDAPEVIIKKRVLKRLINEAVNLFPYQHMFLSICNEDDNEIIIEDFVDNPIFTYELPEGKFSNWELDFSHKTPKNFKENVSTKKVNGYIHTHDTKRISLSDLYYDFIYSCFMKKGDGVFIHAQLDIFYPALKQLVLLNHEKFDGESPIATFHGSGIRPTKNFDRYSRPLEEDKRLIETAKKMAKKEIESNISKYFSVYSSIYDEFICLKPKEANSLFEELELDNSLDDEKIASSRLIRKIKGKIKEFPVNIK